MGDGRRFIGIAICLVIADEGSVLLADGVDDNRRNDETPSASARHRRWSIRTFTFCLIIVRLRGA